VVGDVGAGGYVEGVDDALGVGAQSGVVDAVGFGLGGLILRAWGYRGFSPLLSGLSAMSVLLPHLHGQQSMLQGRSLSMIGARSLFRSRSRSGSWSRSVSRSWSRSMSSFCGHGPDGGPPLSPLDYLL